MLKHIGIRQMMPLFQHHTQVLPMLQVLCPLGANRCLGLQTLLLEEEIQPAIVDEQERVSIARNLMITRPDQCLRRESPIGIPFHAIEQALVFRKLEQSDIPKFLGFVEFHPLNAFMGCKTAFPNR